MILHSTPEFLPREVVVAEELIDAFLTSPGESGYHILVAETEGKIAGYICYGNTPLTEGTWDIYWIAIDRSQRRKGIGGALMREAENRIRKSNGRMAIIETSTKSDYSNTRQFHSSQGYSEIATIPDFYAVGDGKVIMIKRLN